MELRDSRNWDRALEQELPDCRLRAKPTIVRARMLWERVFCANCGTDGGLVTAEWSPHVFYVCNDCVAHAPLDLPQADEMAVRGIKVQSHG
jgi:hypothetical protein